MSKVPTRLRSRFDETQAIEVLEKDDTELRLEKALFGDDAGFLEALRQQDVVDKNILRPVRSSSDEGINNDDENEDLGDVPDEDLFFLDAGTGDLPPAVTKALEAEDGQLVADDRQPTWYDSDDDRITVSLASNTRLRKLRNTEDDDIVTGREYIARLRRQYERLHPTPEWVTYARKRRRTSDGVERTGTDSDSDVSMTDEQDSVSAVQPLAELLRSASSLTRIETHNPGTGKSRKLRPEVIDIQRTKDVTGHGPSSIDTLQFHPYYPLLLTAGPSSTISLYHISSHSPNPNPLLTSLHVKGTPLHTASFCTSQSNPLPNASDPDPTRVFLSSRRRYFHTWTLSTGTVTKTSRPLYGTNKHEQRTTESFKLSPCGRYMGLISSSRKGGGSINILSTQSMQWICSCRLDSAGGLADFDWWRDGNGFAAVGKNGEVSEYSIDSRRVIARWWDEGSVGTTVITIGGDQSSGRYRWVAIGSSSGIVNVYDRRSPEFASILGDSNQNTNTANITTTHRPKPTRTFDQLTTPISHLVFSPDAQLLVLASRWKKNALRLVHLPSCTVYRNWPTDKTPLGRISAVAIGGGKNAQGGLIAVANEQGKVRLWEVRE